MLYSGAVKDVKVKLRQSKSSSCQFASGHNHGNDSSKNFMVNSNLGAGYFKKRAHECYRSYNSHTVFVFCGKFFFFVLQRGSLVRSRVVASAPLFLKKQIPRSLVASIVGECVPSFTSR